MTEKAALFDVDGTLVESGPSIAAAIRAALGELGIPLDPAEDLSWVVGPPLPDIMARLLAPSGDPRVDEACARFRAHYDTAGLLAAVTYPGVASVLDAFAADGWRLFTATSKPRDVAGRLLRHLGIADRFLVIHGADPDDKGLSHKPELIAHILGTERLDAARTIMIGDRRFDITGAHANHVRAVGALWGYGGAEELVQAGADALAESPLDLLHTANHLIRNGHAPHSGKSA